MTFNLEIRKLIKSHYESGMKPREIYKLLNKTVPVWTIYRWIKRLSNGDIKANVSPGRPRRILTKTFIAKVKRNLTQNVKRKSARKLAIDNNCYRRTISRIIAEDLKLKAYKKIPVPDLNEAQIARRYTFSCWIRKYFNHELGISFMEPERWPPNSPDLNPLDYFVWNEIENRLKSKKFSNRDDLIKKIKEVIREIPRKSIRDSFEKFRSRIYALEKNRGQLILNKHS